MRAANTAAKTTLPAPPDDATTLSEDAIYAEILSRAVGSILFESGFRGAERGALNILSYLTRQFLQSVCNSTKRACEHSGRTHVTFHDVCVGLDDNNVLFNEFCAMLEDLRRMPPLASLPPLTMRTEPTPPATMRVGEPRPHPSHMLSFLPPFPDPHTYIHTEISGEVESNYEKVRRIAARNKRNTENSLVSFALATRPSVSLFREYERHLSAEAQQRLKKSHSNNKSRVVAANDSINDENNVDIIGDDSMNEKELQAEALFELKDTVQSHVRRKIPDYCRILLPFAEDRPYLSALVTEENLDDDANHYAKILSQEIENELAADNSNE